MSAVNPIIGQSSNIAELVDRVAEARRNAALEISGTAKAAPAKQAPAQGDDAAIAVETPRPVAPERATAAAAPMLNAEMRTLIMSDARTGDDAPGVSTDPGPAHSVRIMAQLLDALRAYDGKPSA